MFNINSTENSGVKNNHEIEWDRMNLLCKSFFDANCLNDGNGLNSEEGDISSICEENIDHSTKSQSFISRKFVEPKSNIIHDDILYEKCESFNDKNPATTDLIELCLTDSDYLRAKNRWFDFSETELDFASAERMNYINLLTECISNRNFGEHSSNAKKSNSNFEKPLKKEQNKDSRLFSKTQDKPVRKFEFCIRNHEENKYEKGDDAVDNIEIKYPVLKDKDGTSMGNHVGLGENSIINNNKCSVYQAHCGDDHSNQFHNHEKKVATNVFRLGVESTKIPIEQVVDLKQGLLEKEKTTDSACCMKSQTENEEIRKRLENLERIMLAKINSYQFGSTGCGESSVFGEQIGLQTKMSTNNRVELPDKEEPEIFPCRKFGLHKFHNLRKCGHDRGKTLEKLQQVATNDDVLETADDTITNERDPRYLKCQEGVLRIKRKNSLDDLRGSQRISFADSWSEFEIENIFENDRWLKGSLSSSSSSSSSSKRSYVTSDYTLIRRRKKYHRGKRRRRNRKSRKDETLEKFCHQTNKRRAAISEKQQSVKSKEFSSDEKEKKYYEETIASTPTVKGSRIKQYCVIL